MANEVSGTDVTVTILLGVNAGGLNGMTWDQGIAAKPEEVQAVVAASWQS